MRMIMAILARGRGVDRNSPQTGSSGGTAPGTINRSKWNTPGYGHHAEAGRFCIRYQSGRWLTGKFHQILVFIAVQHRSDWPGLRVNFSMNGNIDRDMALSGGQTTGPPRCPGQPRYQPQPELLVLNESPENHA